MGSLVRYSFLFCDGTTDARFFISYLKTHRGARTGTDVTCDIPPELRPRGSLDEMLEWVSVSEGLCLGVWGANGTEARRKCKNILTAYMRGLVSFIIPRICIALDAGTASAEDIRRTAADLARDAQQRMSRDGIGLTISDPDQDGWVSVSSGDRQCELGSIPIGLVSLGDFESTVSDGRMVEDFILSLLGRRQNETQAVKDAAKAIAEHFPQMKRKHLVYLYMICTGYWTGPVGFYNKVAAEASAEDIASLFTDAGISRSLERLLELASGSLSEVPSMPVARPPIPGA